MALTWHVLVDAVEFPWDCLRDWIETMHVDVPEESDPFCAKLAAFFGSGRLVDGDRYVVLCDDDMFDVGVLAAVEAMEERIVVVSMLRGHQTPARGRGYAHPTTTLRAGKDSMRVGEVGLQQCFVAGEIYREALFDARRAPFCDGLVAEWLAESYGELIRYEPELYVMFNRLEPGRWAVDTDETRVMI